jgi:hypothetical protein
MRPKLSYANVMSTLCFFLLLGGGAYAAGHLGKNTVGSKQLKKNAVTTAKIKNKAVTGAKIKPGTITGTQVDASTLGTVPVANLANSIAPPESAHLVGGAAEPAFQHNWTNAVPEGGSDLNPVGFYKDREGFVHLQGLAAGGEANRVVFQLPPGYRPGPHKLIVTPAACAGGGCSAAGTGVLLILGSNSSEPEGDGAILMNAATIGLDGITFRAES